MSSASALLAQANKKATGGGGFSLFGGGSAKWEEAKELYEEAANAFKAEKAWRESGDAHMKAAEMALKTNEKDDAAAQYWNASKAYKKEYPELAVAALQETIKIYTARGRLRQAADREKDVALIYLSIAAGEGPNSAEAKRSALNAYERAADWYSNEDATATANACLKEAADLAADLDMFSRAVDHYETVAEQALKSPMTKYSVREYYLKSGLCWLATGDVVSTRRAVDNYSAADPAFPSTREHKLLIGLLDAYDAGDPEGFSAAALEFDRLTRLDPWKTSILLKIRTSIADEPGLT